MPSLSTYPHHTLHFVGGYQKSARTISEVVSEGFLPWRDATNPPPAGTISRLDRYYTSPVFI
ncbi:MAG: hypothetical protein KAU38_13745 [Desulfobacterales bacterium]|nr:hypothetical protein [Desulfobacterales bacterium]